MEAITVTSAWDCCCILRWGHGCDSLKVWKRCTWRGRVLRRSLLSSSSRLALITWKKVFGVNLFPATWISPQASSHGEKREPISQTQLLWLRELKLIDCSCFFLSTFELEAMPPLPLPPLYLSGQLLVSFFVLFFILPGNVFIVVKAVIKWHAADLPRPSCFKKRAPKNKKVNKKSRTVDLLPTGVI